MKIVVLIKEVPDTYGERTLDLETGLAERAKTDRVLDEIGERAVETALRHADEHPDTEVIVLSMGPAESAATVRKALAMGAARAVQVVDEALIGADLSYTAEVLAAALRTVGFDLVITGDQSTDGSGGVVPAMLAELLDLPQLTSLAELTIEESSVRGVRSADDVTTELTAELPAIVSVTERMPDARFPNFKGIMAAKKKPFETLSLADLGVPAPELAPRAIMLSVTRRPPRAAGTTIVDEGDAGERIADFLVENRLV